MNIVLSFSKAMEHGMAPHPKAALLKNRPLAQKIIKQIDENRDLFSDPCHIRIEFDIDGIGTLLLTPRSRTETHKWHTPATPVSFRVKESMFLEESISELADLDLVRPLQEKIKSLRQALA
jgi:hypothetical protein